MMNMQNANCCEGCFYAGVVNGYKPDCNCMEAAETKARDNKSANTDMVEDYWDKWNQYIFDEESDFTDTKDRSKAVRRRINKAKANKKAVRVLPIVNSKVAHVSTNDDDTEFEIRNKKYNNISKTAKRRYRMTITIPFPLIHKRYYRVSLSELITLFNNWKDAAAFDGNNTMVLACKNAISTLETAKNCGGELSALHRERNVLHAKVGFWDKTSMLDFKSKTSSNS